MIIIIIDKGGTLTNGPKDKKIDDNAQDFTFENDFITCGRNIGAIGNQRKNWDHQDCMIVEINQNTQKSPGNLRKLGVTQTPVKDNQQTLV